MASKPTLTVLALDCPTRRTYLTDRTIVTLPLQDSAVKRNYIHFAVSWRSTGQFGGSGACKGSCRVSWSQPVSWWSGQFFFRLCDGPVLGPSKSRQTEIVLTPASASMRANGLLSCLSPVRSTQLARAPLADFLHPLAATMIISFILLCPCKSLLRPEVTGWRVAACPAGMRCWFVCLLLRPQPATLHRFWCIWPPHLSRIVFGPQNCRDFEVLFAMAGASARLWSCWQSR